MPPLWKVIQQELTGTVIKEEKDWGGSIFIGFMCLCVIAICGGIIFHFLNSPSLPTLSIIQCKSYQDLTTCIVVDEQGLMYKLSHMEVN